MRIIFLLVVLCLTGCAAPRYAVRASYQATPARVSEGVLQVQFEVQP